MKRTVLILLVIAGLLLVLRWRREGFEATSTIKTPSTWDAAEYTRIRKLVNPESTLDDTEIQRVIGGFWSYAIPSSVAGESATQKGWSVATSQITTADLTAYLNEMYRTNVIADPAKRSKFQELLNAYYITQGQSVFQAARDYSPPPATTPTGSTGTTSSSGTVERPSSASTRLRQEIATTAGVTTSNDAAISPFVTLVQRFYDTVYLPDKRMPTTAEITAFADGIDPSSYPASIRNNFKVHLIEILDSYFETASRTADQGPIGSPTGGAGVQMGGGQSQGGPGTTTAPASSSTTASTGPRGFDLYGPGYTERGSPYVPNGGPGSPVGERGRYPTVYGGGERVQSDRMGPTGPTLPSSASLGTDPGSFFPTSASLGTDLGSMFFPTSRTPGDMDVVPDPFRALNNFSLASYTPKTDPVPFLPDFSAFQR